jgi:hypothetical protein
VNCGAVRFSCHDLRTLQFHTESENSTIKSDRFEKTADASILVKLINSQQHTFRSLAPSVTQIGEEMREIKVKGKGEGHPRTGHEGPEME